MAQPASPTSPIVQRLAFGTISPQRYIPRQGWQPALPATADGWLAVPRKGRAQRFKRKAEALAYLDRAFRLSLPSARSGTGPAVATSLTKLEWMALQQTPRPQPKGQD